MRRVKRAWVEQPQEGVRKRRATGAAADAEAYTDEDASLESDTDVSLDDEVGTQCQCQPA